MTKQKPIPRWSFAVAGVLYILSGLISVISDGANLLSVITAIFHGHGFWWMSGVLWFIMILCALLTLALGVALVVTRRNTVGIPIILGASVALNAVSLVVSLANQVFSYGAYPRTVFESVYFILNACMNLVGFLALLLLLLLAIFNLRGKRGICKAWIVPVLFRLLSVGMSAATVVLSYIVWSEISIMTALVDLGTVFVGLCSLLAFAFLCFGLSRVAEKTPAPVDVSPAPIPVDAAPASEQVVEEPAVVTDEANTQNEPEGCTVACQSEPVEPEPTSDASYNGEPIEALRSYKALLDEGVITQEEFDAKKKQLLGL